MNHQVTEGYMPFMGYQTYYRIVGGPSEKSPLLLLHGGPGSTHNYFEVLDCIADTGRQVISYDQIGCGNSYLDGHPELWTLKTWIDELIAIRQYLHLDNVHILGQSWGGHAGNSIRHRPKACGHQVANLVVGACLEYIVGQRTAPSYQVSACRQSGGYQAGLNKSITGTANLR